MRISYSKYPVLKHFEDDIIRTSFNLYGRKQEWIQQYNEEVSPGLMFGFKRSKKALINIHKVSKSFIEVLEGDAKMAELLKTIIKKQIPEYFYDTFIVDDYVYVYYCHDPKEVYLKKDSVDIKTSDDMVCYFYKFDKFGNPISFYGDDRSFIGTEKEKYNFYWHYSDSYSQSEIEEKVQKDMIFCMGLSMLKKYGEVETLLIPPRKKIKHNGQKHSNEIGRSVNLLDSRWLYNLVRSESFKVAGHWRLQPYKNKQKETYYKIIWISDFEKNGYTSKARKTLEQNENIL